MQTLPAQPVELIDGEPEARPGNSEVAPKQQLRPTGRPSPKLAQMQREQAVKITTNLLVRKAKKEAQAKRVATMKALMICAALACCAATVTAQPRDGFMNESRDEAAAAECRASPDCMRAYRRQQALDAERQVTYEAKPWTEKALPWVVLVGIAAALYMWAGRK